ncbi:Na+/H+ antiporter NhaC family protein [Clostridium thermarum]|uniref:Na+/H+ antiporter NhaC family protein n=1 Tax=Clostridium thermarum TaxID=1716543 RepID=UPI001FA971AA|nr:Na+/H+ antiporter NhaC family protein [Clostridium thermarum]
MNTTNKGKLSALLPLLVFIIIFVALSVISGDFYAVPVIVPFLIAAIVALFMNRKLSINQKLDIFCKGAGEGNIILMCLIFILAGAFAEIAKAMGAVEATVNLGLTYIPSNILVSGIFIIACFISLSIGTSMGTIATLVPIAVGISQKTGIPMALIVGAVVGGSMFGDNLSMISDTTIAATKTQGCEMKDKFRMNFFIVLPAAIISAIIFGVISIGKGSAMDISYSYDLIKVVPYISVLIAALFGVNVLYVLIGGSVFSGIIGMAYGAFDIVGLMQAAAKGISGMSELIIISLIIGGMVELMKYNGGIDFILNLVTRGVKSKTGAELGIAALVSLVDICTANNTIAIVTVGPIAKDIADQYGVEPKRSASILDMFSCVFQGIIPYGAQLLSAASLAGLSSLSIMRYLYYPYLMGICALITIIFSPRLKK